MEEDKNSTAMRLLTIALMLLMSSVIRAQNMTLSLSEAQSKAMELNKKAQVSELEIEKAERVVKETLAIGLPQIEASGSFQNFLDVPTQVLPDFISPAVYGVLINENLLPEGSGGEPGFIPAQFGTEYTVTGGATLSQLIFNGSYLIGLKAAKSYVEMSRLQKLKSDLEVREAVAQAYHTTLLADDNASVMAESIGTLESMLNEISAMYDEGFLEEQDVEQMQLTLNTLKSQHQNAVRQKELTMQLLNFQIGLPLETQLTLTDGVDDLTTDPDIDQLMLTEAPIEAHPDLLIVDQGVLLNELKVKEQKSRYLPSLNGFFSYQQQAQRNEFNFFESGQDWFPNTVWGLNLSLPIFSSGMKHQKVKQLEIDLEESRIQREMAKDGLSLEALRAKSDYQFAKENYLTEEENLGLAARIRDKTRVKYQEGLASSFELNEMESQYIQAQGRRIQASMSLLTALTELKKAYNRL